LITIDIDTEGIPIEFLETALLRATQNSLDVLLGEVTQYPPPPPRSRYKRGGPGSQNLGQQWFTEIEETSEGLLGLLGNNVSYGPYVQSEARQARVHRGRWDTVEGIAREQLDLIERIFVVELENALGS
jgi:hypothetical protein